jgi:hypothetical protein
MEACDVYLTEYANLHPYSRYSLQAAVEQMRRELLDRKRRLRTRARKPRTPEVPPADQATTSGQPVGGLANIPTTGEGAPQLNQAPPLNNEVNRANGSKKPFRPPMTREERAAWERKQFRQSVQPVEPTSKVVSAEERAENELVRALLEPEWRSTVQKHISPDQYLSSLGQQFAKLVAEMGAGMNTPTSDIIRLVEAQSDALFSSAIRDRVQEFQTQMANVPITEEVIVKAALTLKKYSKTRRYHELEEELARLLQKTPLSVSESILVKELTQERQQLLKELRG